LLNVKASALGYERLLNGRTYAFPLKVPLIRGI